MAPTPVVKQDLEKFGFTNVVLWTRGVDLDIFRPMDSKVLNTARPIFLYVGRVAIEKNVEAFLRLDLPGSKWVAGEGPALAELKSRYPEANYLGVLSQAELAKVYAAADVFVFPSRTDTFGLVLLALAHAGCRVPVTGPIDVLGGGNAGAMHEDLQEACLEAPKIERDTARAWAERFSWRAASEQFASTCSRCRRLRTRPPKVLPFETRPERPHLTDCRNGTHASPVRRRRAARRHRRARVRAARPRRRPRAAAAEPVQAPSRHHARGTRCVIR
jgi:glycosyltransferase involved in cell wall biosynthesis